MVNTFFMCFKCVMETFQQGKFGRAASWYFLNQSFTFSLTSYEFIGLTSFSTPAIFQALMYPHNELKDVKALLDQFSRKSVFLKAC